MKGVPCGIPGGGKWYAVEPRGFVCEGREGITTDVDDPAVKAGALFPPKVNEPFPYAYATSWGSPLYVRVPTADEQRHVEGNIEARVLAREAQRMKMSPARRWPESALPTEALPPFLADHAVAPNFTDQHFGDTALTAGNAWVDLRLSLTRAFAAEGRTFYLTSENFVVPADRVRPARLADFHGLELAPPDQPGEHLPFTWVNWKPVVVFHLDEDGSLRATKATMPVEAHATIANDEFVRGPQHYFELKTPPEGLPPGRYFVPAGSASRVDAATELPPNVKETNLWIDISISHQTLVLYRGLLPLYATLVSTGIDGAQDIEKTRSTPRGTFPILSKHISARMAADERAPQNDGDKPDPRYRVDDVPYVQYFHRSYAIHGAYWHDAFGQPKSHGCVNVSPRDALYLFQHTTPAIPEGWHAAMSGRPNRDGSGPEPLTYVHVRL